MLKQPGFVIDISWIEKKLNEAEHVNKKLFKK